MRMLVKYEQITNDKIFVNGKRGEQHYDIDNDNWLALWSLHGCFSATKKTQRILTNTLQQSTLNWKHTHNETKSNKTVHIFHAYLVVDVLFVDLVSNP